MIGLGSQSPVVMLKVAPEQENSDVSQICPWILVEKYHSRRVFIVQKIR